MLSAVTTSLLVCVVKLFIWYVAVCCLCVCECLSGTHTHRQHTATYQINNWTTQTSREVVTALSTEDGPPEDGQTIVTETCRVLIDVFYKHFLTT